MEPPPASPAEAADAEASRLTLRGIDLMEQGDREALTQAAACFQNAILLREDLPLDQNPAWRWGLSAGWLNLAEALMRLNGRESREQILACFSAALGQLKHLPPEACPQYRWRHALAWTNCGQAAELGGDAKAMQAALTCYENALRLMEGQEQSSRPDFRQVQAAAWLNRGGALLSQAPPQNDPALACARMAMHHVRHLEAQGAAQADTGVKARHLLCRILAAKLETPDLDAAEAEVWIHEATDAVEEVMALSSKLPGHEPLREEMFHFGCRIYRAFQPHFLAAFLNDGLKDGTASEAMRTAAREALAQAVLQYRHEPLAGLSPEKMEKLLHTLQALAETARLHAAALQSEDKTLQPVMKS